MPPLNSRKRKTAAAAAAAALIAAPAEGIRQYAYYDPPGILTVCYGHTGPDVQAKVLYPMVECKRLLAVDMAQAIDTVDRCAPNAPESVLTAFGDAVYNMGPTIACDQKNSTAARLLAAGRWYEACRQLVRWDKAKVAGMLVSLPGLTKRRQAEFVVCVKGVPS